ncbi:MAG: flavodoxin-dependent (E)-4-hydroxy-3-methylbut-2-enyl-diphosphate synthase [Succinivibrio sp.]|uniref:flavodoxin-dependent (E)-4-hydroxy-3-methylbut-2-enyl-diphosphate synthase n=1 Tax=Succinivibrio sp. TaxID=2053619 RepID=UPI002F94918D
MEWKAPKIQRRKSRQITVGTVKVGGDAPISVQSMTCTDTMDVEATVNQILALEKAGADIVRVTVPTLEATDAFEKIVKQVHIPVVSDIHFDYRIAIECAKKGAAALRINPGNIGSHEKIEMVCQAAKDHGLPIRVGVNAGSLDKDLLEKYGSPCPDAMVEAALRAAQTLDEHNFTDYAFSVKASELNLCVTAYRQLAQKTDAPLHLGITEAGGLTGGTVLSAIGIGQLLQDGIGDTIRVSLAADPVEEIKVGWAILKSLHLRSRGAEIVACPTCGRRGIDVVATVNELESRLSDIRQSIKIAVMGCVVNGPGEAKHADIAVCGAAKGNCLIYENGEMMGKFPCSQAVQIIEDRVRARVK